MAASGSGISVVIMSAVTFSLFRTHGMVMMGVEGGTPIARSDGRKTKRTTPGVIKYIQFVRSTRLVCLQADRKIAILFP